MKKIARALVFVFCFALSSVLSNAQEIVVTSFELKATDLTAKIDPVYDLNDEACALVKVAIPGKKVSFKGDIIKEPESISGEYHIYLPEGTKRLTVSVENYLPLVFEFPVNLEKFRTYSLRLRLVDPEKKVNVTIMPSFSWSTTQTAYGIMIGLTGKRHGGFIHAKSDFNFLTTAGETTDRMWFTGNSEKGRWAVTGGYLVKLAKPLYVFVGAGYGDRTLSWEASDALSYRVPEFSSKGVEAELGAFLKFGAFVFGASAQTNMFHFYDYNAYIGVMF